MATVNPGTPKTPQVAVADPQVPKTLSGSEEHYKVKGSRQAGSPPEPLVLKRLERAEMAIRRQEPRWRELWAMFDNDQYVEASAVDGRLQRPTTREGGKKPRWRPRLVRNRFTKNIAGAVAVLFSRIPVWECTPQSSDHRTRNAARMGEKVLMALYVKLNLRNLAFRVGIVAGVTGDGWVWPRWDPTVGKQVLDDEGRPTGKREGEIELQPLRQDQVMWQPNCKFEQSRWYAVRLAQPLEDLMARDDYAGPSKEQGGIPADATTAALDLRDGDGVRDLVFVYHYYERPSAKHREGRYLCIAGKYIVAPVYEYPLWVYDQLAPIHRVPWFERPHRDRSIGIGELIIDVQRTINRILNQMIAWRNLVLAPQMLAPVGSVQTAVTDEPGLVIQYRPTGGGKPEWRPVADTPETLFKELERAYADIDDLAGGSAELPAAIASGSGVQAVNEREMAYRSMQVANLAKFWADLGQHLLCLVQQHYTEERLLVIQGRFGAELIPDFLGEDIEGWGTVRVAEASIEPRTRAAQEAKIMAFADKGWIAPFQAMAALSGGQADSILDSFELDIAKCHRNIEALKLMGQMLGDGPPVAGPMDNHQVHIDELTQWMKTMDFERQPPAVQLAGQLLLQQHELEAQGDAMEAAMQVDASAGSQGMENAGRPQGDVGTGQPSRPSIANEAAALAGAPPNP